LIRRALLLWVCVLGGGGSLLATAGYGLRLHSAPFRRQMERELADFFDLPCDIGAIRPLTFSSRAFDEVAVWLKDRRARVFQCRLAVWHERRVNGSEIHDLDLADGAMTLDLDRWQPVDYADVLDAGLRRDYTAARLDRVRLTDFDLQVRAGAIEMRCGEAEGEVSLADPSDGRARLAAAELNGHRPLEPIQVHARFSHARGVQFRELVLTVPEMPLAAVGVDRALDVATSGGRFRGRIEYRQDGSIPHLRVSGHVADVALHELTAALPTGPLHGLLDVAIDEAQIVNRSLSRLLGHAEVRGLRLADISSLLGGHRLSGSADLSIRAIDAADGGIRHLLADGGARDVALEDLSAFFDYGRATGRLRVVLNGLRVREGAIEWADLRVESVPAPGQAAAGWFDRRLLLTGLREFVDVTWPEKVPPEVLPGEIEYRRLGVRLLVEHNRLRVLGTHGPRRDTILTIRLLGMDVGVVKSLRREIDLTPWLAEVRRRLTERPRPDYSRWLRPPPTARPE